MTDKEREWVETNNAVCALLKQAHDVLALSSLAPRREWVGLTGDEIEDLNKDQTLWEIIRAAEEILKERNNEQADTNIHRTVFAD